MQTAGWKRKLIQAVTVAQGLGAVVMVLAAVTGVVVVMAAALEVVDPARV